MIFFPKVRRRVKRTAPIGFARQGGGASSEAGLPSHSSESGRAISRAMWTDWEFFHGDSVSVYRRSRVGGLALLVQHHSRRRNYPRDANAHSQDLFSSWTIHCSQIEMILNRCSGRGATYSSGRQIQIRTEKEREPFHPRTCIRGHPGSHFIHGHPIFYFSGHSYDVEVNNGLTGRRITLTSNSSRWHELVPVNPQSTNTSTAERSYSAPSTDTSTVAVHHPRTHPRTYAPEERYVQRTLPSTSTEVVGEAVDPRERSFLSPCPAARPVARLYEAIRLYEAKMLRTRQILTKFHSHPRTSALVRYHPRTHSQCSIRYHSAPIHWYHVNNGLTGRRITLTSKIHLKTLSSSTEVAMARTSSCISTDTFTEEGRSSTVHHPRTRPRRRVITGHMLRKRDTYKKKASIHGLLREAEVIEERKVEAEVEVEACSANYSVYAIAAHAIQEEQFVQESLLAIVCRCILYERLAERALYSSVLSRYRAHVHMCSVYGKDREE